LQSDVSENPILWVSAGSPQRHPDGSLYTHQVAYRDGSMSYHASNALPKEVQDFYARTADTKGDALDPVQIIRGDGHSGMANVYDERGHLIGQQNAGSTTMSLPGKPGQAYGEVPQDVYDTGRVAEYQQAQASRSINPLADRQAMEVAAAAEHNKGQIGAARLNANAHIEASTNLLKQPHAQSTVERNDLTGATKETTYGPVLNADGTPAKPRQPQAGTVTPGKVAGRVYTDKNGNRATYKGKDASGQDVWEKK
jgi:hypothetical protein